MKLSATAEYEMRRTAQYYPFRKISAVVLPTGEYTIFANHTAAKARNFARKNGGTIYQIENSK